MEINSVNATVPTDRQSMSTESSEPKATERNETTTQETREAYKVDISREAAQKTMEAAASEENTASGPENSEEVKAYTNTGKIAG